MEGYPKIRPEWVPSAYQREVETPHETGDNSSGGESKLYGPGRKVGKGRTPAPKRVYLKSQAFTRKTFE